MRDKLVQTIVEGRFCDSSISVTEIALELVGRHITSHPDAVEGNPKYWEVVSSALAIGWLDIVVKLLRLHGSYQQKQIGSREVEEMTSEEMELRTLPYVLLFNAFCVVDPALCEPASNPSQFLVTLQSYLKSQIVILEDLKDESAEQVDVEVEDEPRLSETDPEAAGPNSKTDGRRCGLCGARTDGKPPKVLVQDGQDVVCVAGI